MLFKLEPRLTQSRVMRVGAPLIAVALTLLLGIALFIALGFDPFSALVSFFIHPIDSWIELGDLGVKGAPLLLCALGLAVGFRGNVWNIGAEGQLTIGAIAGGGVALAFHGMGGWFILPLMIVTAIAAGAAWAAIPAFLRTRFHANEILTSLMLTYVALHLLGFLVHGPWRSPSGFNFPVSRDFGDDARFPYILNPTELHFGVLLAVLAVPVMWLLMQRSYMGFQVRVSGLAPRAADYAGFKASRVVWIGMLFGGGFAGLAGLGEVAGPIGKLQDTISPGYGFAAIIVAYLGRLHPVGIFFASVLMALLYLGGSTAQIELKIPPAVTGVFQGMLLFFLLGADIFVRYRLRWAGRPASEAQKAGTQ